MAISTVRFTELEEEISETSKSHLEHLAPDTGKVYVITISREGCSACERQKPDINRLAKAMMEKHEDKVLFTRIHVRQPPGSQEESLRSKDMLGHYFYPTNLVLLRTIDCGAIELYRNVSPEMDELEKNIEIAIKIAATLQKEMK